MALNPTAISNLISSELTRNAGVLNQINATNASQFNTRPWTQPQLYGQFLIQQFYLLRYFPSYFLEYCMLFDEIDEILKRESALDCKILSVGCGAGIDLAALSVSALSWAEWLGVDSTLWQAVNANSTQPNNPAPYFSQTNKTVAVLQNTFDANFIRGGYTKGKNMFLFPRSFEEIFCSQRKKSNPTPYTFINKGGQSARSYDYNLLELLVTGSAFQDDHVVFSFSTVDPAGWKAQVLLEVLLDLDDMMESVGYELVVGKTERSKEECYKIIGGKNNHAFYPKLQLSQYIKAGQLLSKIDPTLKFPLLRLSSNYSLSVYRKEKDVKGNNVDIDKDDID